MAKKRTVVPDFAANARPGAQRNVPPPVKGKGKAGVVRVKPQSTSAKSGQRGQ